MSASPERTLRVQHPRIRFIRLSERHGPAHARNVGASVAVHPMLFFADADRIVPPDVLSSHHLRHRDSDRPSIIVGGLFGRKVATFLEPSKIDSRVIRKLLEQLRFAREQFYRTATATQFGGSIDLVKQNDRRPLWHSVEPLTFADPYLAGWAPYVAQHGQVVHKPFRFLRLGTGNVVGRQNIGRSQNQSLGDNPKLGCSDKILAMIVSLRHLLGWVFSVVRSREDLLLENLALRQQLLALSAIFLNPKYLAPWRTTAPMLSM